MILCIKWLLFRTVSSVFLALQCFRFLFALSSTYCLLDMNNHAYISSTLAYGRYFCLAVWPSIFATCNRRDKNKLSLPVQYCHFGSIHLTTDVSTKKISVSQYCPNNTLQITSIQLIININHMAARSGSSRWIPSVAGGKTYNISWSNGLQDYTQLFRSVWDQY